VVKQKGMMFGFRKTATAVVGPEIEEDIVIYFYGGLVPIAVHIVLQFKKQETVSVDVDRFACPLELLQTVPF
jgi:hypothetical protein